MTRAEWTESMNRLFPDYPDEKIKLLVDTKMHDQRNLILRGDNVIQFMYAGHIVEEEILQQYRNRLAPHNLQLSFQDINTMMTASAGDFYSAVGQLYIASELFRSLIASAA